MDTQAHSEMALTSIALYTGKTTSKYGTATGPSSSKLLHDRTVGLPIRVRVHSETTFEYYVHGPQKAKYKHSSCLFVDLNGRANGVDMDVYSGCPVSHLSLCYFLLDQ